MPLVRANMQGVNGRVVEKEYFDRLCFLLREKGACPASFPELENLKVDMPALKNERDVERYLLEPLLREIGYEEKDWQRQVSVKIGRKERIVPDYVIFPILEPAKERAFWIWEAKYSIRSEKQLRMDFNQARSYALRLRCSGLGLLSKEGVWAVGNSLEYENIRFWSWYQLEEKDLFGDFLDVVGKKKKF